MPEADAQQTDAPLDERVRAFIAFEPPASIVDAALASQQLLRAKAASCGARVSFVSAGNMHVTIAFLGDPHSLVYRGCDIPCTAHARKLRVRWCNQGHSKKEKNKR